MYLPTLGFVGLGSMGGPMARNLLKAGYTLTVFDLDPQKAAACAGAQPAATLAEVVQNNMVVLTSVPSFEVAEKVARELLPYAQPGQIFIELSTLTPTQAEQLASDYAAQGATRLDVPVSGGSVGAERGNLRMFVGGDQAAAEKCWPILEILGDAARIVYCGQAGRGQMVKIVNQVAMGLSNAIYLETIGFAARMGIGIDLLIQGIGGDDAWRKQFERIAQHIQNGDPVHTDVKFVQLKQFADDAEARGYTMPMTRALFEFCDAGERVTQEEIYPSPSFWHELMKDRSSK